MLPIFIHRRRMQQPETRTTPVLIAIVASALACGAGVLLLF